MSQIAFHFDISGHRLTPGQIELCFDIFVTYSGGGNRKMSRETPRFFFEFVDCHDSDRLFNSKTMVCPSVCGDNPRGYLTYIGSNMVELFYVTYISLDLVH